MSKPLFLEDMNKMSAYQRLCSLVDQGSLEVLHNHGVVTGRGMIDGRPVYAYAQDSSVNAGSMTEATAEKICELMDMALTDMVPLISINESAGAHIQEGVRSLAGFGDIFQRNIKASGVIPQISGIFGPCAGGAVYSPALTDFTVMVKDSSYMFITGPGVVKAVTAEDVTKEELGGAGVHASKSGVAHFAEDNEHEALQTIRQLLAYLPSNNKEQTPRYKINDSIYRIDESLNQIVPDNPKKPYNIYKVIESIVDEGRFLEVHKGWARNIVVGFARMNGRSVGLVANQPKILAGVLDGDASRKAARFVRFCDAFNIPIITLADVPGFLCGTQQEYSGVITQGAKLIYAYGEATVPKVTVVLRKAYGGAYVSMGCKQLGGDVNFAWPSAQIAVMGAESAAEVISSRPQDFIEDYKSRISNPQNAIENGSLDEIIEPSTTRRRVIDALEKISATRPAALWKKHDNMPL